MSEATGILEWLRNLFSGSENRLRPARVASDRGAALVEYALLIALIALVCIGSVVLFGSNIGDSISSAGTSLQN